MLNSIDSNVLERAIEQLRNARPLNRLPTLTLLDRCIFSLKEKEAQLTALDSASTCTIESLQRRVESLTAEIQEIKEKEECEDGNLTKT